MSNNSLNTIYDPSTVFSNASYGINVKTLSPSRSNYQNPSQHANPGTVYVGGAMMYNGNPNTIKSLTAGQPVSKKNSAAVVGRALDRNTAGLSASELLQFDIRNADSLGLGDPRGFRRYHDIRTPCTNPDGTPTYGGGYIGHPLNTYLFGAIPSEPVVEINPYGYNTYQYQSPTGQYCGAYYPYAYSSPNNIGLYNPQSNQAYYSPGCSGGSCGNGSCAGTTGYQNYYNRMF